MSKRYRRSRGRRGALPVSPSGRELSRRAWLRVAGGTVAAATVAALLGRRLWATADDVGKMPITVYASPTCSCCHSWVRHLAANGFDITTHAVSDVTPVKRERNIPDSLWSCHTAVVADYTIEGHVPADVIRKLLNERRAVAGLAVPGMPSSAPGMDGPPSAYTVLAFATNGTTSVYAER